MKIVGNKMQELRNKKGLTALEVAQELEISLSSYTKYENGDRVPREEIREKIASYYGVSVPSLFYA